MNLRAWDTDTSQMYYFNLEEFMGTHESAQEEMCPYNRRTIIMLSTNIHDKNGKEIFDKDIVKVAVNPIDLNGYRICEVRILNWSGAKLFINDQICAFGYDPDIEVIGNKLENPEIKEGLA